MTYKPRRSWILWFCASRIVPLCLFFTLWLYLSGSGSWVVVPYVCLAFFFGMLVGIPFTPFIPIYQINIVEGNIWGLSWNGLMAKLTSIPIADVELLQSTKPGNWFPGKICASDGREILLFPWLFSPSQIEEMFDNIQDSLECFSDGGAGETLERGETPLGKAQRRRGEKLPALFIRSREGIAVITVSGTCFVLCVAAELAGLLSGSHAMICTAVISSGSAIGLAVGIRRVARREARRMQSSGSSRGDR